MTYKIQGEQPFQVLASNFSIGPSNEGYTLQISADGRNYSDLFSVGANVTRMVTGVANGSYYRLSGNDSLVTVNWNKQCSDGQGGGGGSTYILPPATDRTLGGIKVGSGLTVQADGTLSANGGGGSGDAFILKSSSSQPSGLSLGDIYAITSNTRTIKPTEVVSSVTVTYTGSEITFKFYAGDTYYYDQGGIDGNGNIYGAWGTEGDVILGPWGSTYGIQVTSNGNEYTFTTLNPGNYESSQMYGFNIDIEVSGKSYELYQAIDDGNGGATEKDKIAKVSDLPADNQLVPVDGSSDEYLRKGGEGPEWVSIRQVPFTDMQKDYTGAVLMSTGQYADTYGWGFIDNAVLDPVSAAPETAKDGAVYALSSSGYGIVQAQSAHTGMTWVNFEGKTFPQGSVTKVRVPYNDTAESNIVHIKTDPNGSGQMDLYWHPENSDDKHWDGVPDGYSQNDGEFNAVDQWGNTMVATKVGDYIEVTFGAPLYDGDEQISTYRNTEAYTEADITDYTNVVMSNDVTKIKKMTQAAYDALTVKDPNTLYIIIEINTGV